MPWCTTSLCNFRLRTLWVSWSHWSQEKSGWPRCTTAVCRIKGPGAIAMKSHWEHSNPEQRVSSVSNGTMSPFLLPEDASSPECFVFFLLLLFGNWASVRSSPTSAWVLIHSRLRSSLSDRPWAFLAGELSFSLWPWALRAGRLRSHCDWQGEISESGI